MSVPTVAVIGEALMDVHDSGDGATFTARVGGSPLNVAVGLARLQQPTAYLGRFSRDGFGSILHRYAEAADLDLRAAVRAEQPSTIAVVRLDEHGVASYDFTVEGTADWGWTPGELRALPDSAELVHFGSLTSWLPPGAAVLGEFIDSLRTAGDRLISYDPNVRPGLLGSASAARELIEPRVAAAHLVKASREDLDWLYAGTAPAAVAARWLALGSRLVLVTDGGAGTTAYRLDGPPIQRPAMAVELVDTVGAGDAFTSGLLDGLLRIGAATPTTFTPVLADSELLARLLDEAAVVAGLTCARAGANPPTRAEVDAVNRGV